MLFFYGFIKFALKSVQFFQLSNDVSRLHSVMNASSIIVGESEKLQERYTHKYIHGNVYICVSLQKLIRYVNILQ